MCNDIARRLEKAVHAVVDLDVECAFKGDDDIGDLEGVCSQIE